MTAYRFFGIQKCSCYNSNLITSLNNTVKQISAARIPLSLRMFEVFTASSKLQHQPSVALFEKFFTALSIGPCGRLS